MYDMMFMGKGMINDGICHDGVEFKAVYLDRSLLVFGWTELIRLVLEVYTFIPFLYPSP